MSTLDAFKQQHPNCLVRKIQYKHAGNKVDCHLIVVPNGKWHVHTDDSAQTNKELYKSWEDSNPYVRMQPTYAATNVTPSEKVEGNWPPMYVDMYMIFPENVFVNLKKPTELQSSHFTDYQKFYSYKVNHIGQVNLTKDMDGTTRTDIVTSWYRLDLRFNTDCKYLNSSDSTPEIILIFNVHRNPASDILDVRPGSQEVQQSHRAHGLTPQSKYRLHERVLSRAPSLSLLTDMRLQLNNI